VFALLQAGAKPELTHDMPGPGYTVAMRAAELDEVELLDAFQKSSTAVSLTDTYLEPVEQRPIGLGAIATYFGAKRVLDYLKREFKSQTKAAMNTH
jgi:hypothetical protein